MSKKRPDLDKQQQTAESIVPVTPGDFRARAWLYFYAKQPEKAEADFQAALQAEPGDLDTLFGLGLALKGQGRFDEAVRTYQEVLEKSVQLDDRVRATMVKRLAQGHINEIKLGDWNLEKEIWKRK